MANMWMTMDKSNGPLDYSPGKQARIVARPTVLKPEDALHVTEELARLAHVLRVVKLCDHRELVWVLQVKVGIWGRFGMALRHVFCGIPKKRK